MPHLSYLASQLVNEKQKILNRSFLFHLLLIQDVELPWLKKPKKEDIKKFYDTMAHRLLLQLDDQSEAVPIKVSAIGLPQFFEVKYRELMSTVNIAHADLVEVLIKAKARKIPVTHENKLFFDEALAIYATRSRHIMQTLDQYDAPMQAYLLMHLSISKIMVNLIKWKLELPSNVSDIQAKRLDNPSVNSMLGFIVKWLADNQVLSESMNEYLGYLQCSHDRAFIGFKEFQTSYLCGVVGETLFAEQIAGMIVGQEGKKQDVSSASCNFSIKSSQTSDWRNHLAYMQLDKYPDFKNLESETFSLRGLGYSNQQWAALVNQLIQSDDDIRFLVFQQITVNEEMHVVDERNWLCAVQGIVENVAAGNFFFRKTTLHIVAPNKETFFSLQFQPRNGGKKIQVMISTEDKLLMNASECMGANVNYLYKSK